MKNFSDLTEQELLALAIALEEEDSRTYSRPRGGDVRELSRNGAHVRRDGGGGRPPSPPPRHLPREVRRPHPADPPARREGLHRAQVVVACTAAQPRKSACPGGADGGGDQALLPGGGTALDRRRHPSAPRRSRSGRAPPRGPGGGARGAICAGRGREGGG